MTPADTVTGSVEVHYQGRLGNRLTQYCIGRIIAEELRFSLEAEAIPGFPRVQSLATAAAPRARSVQALGGHRIDLDRILADKTPRRIILGGFFQRYEYVRPYKDRIRGDWLASDSCAPSASDEITVHVRSGDIWLSNNPPGRVHTDYHALPFSFYSGILTSQRFGRVTIVTEDGSDPMVRKIAERFDAHVQSGSVIDDFDVLRRSANLVLSVSSFAWWAGWLSDAARIFYPVAGCFDTVRNRARAVAWQQDFWVDNEPRYVAIRPQGVLHTWTGTSEDRARLLAS